MLAVHADDELGISQPGVFRQVQRDYIIRARCGHGRRRGRRGAGGCAVQGLDAGDVGPVQGLVVRADRGIHDRIRVRCVAETQGMADLVQRDLLQRGGGARVAVAAGAVRSEGELVRVLQADDLIRHEGSGAGPAQAGLADHTRGRGIQSAEADADIGGLAVCDLREGQRRDGRPLLQRPLDGTLIIPGNGAAEGIGGITAVIGSCEAVCDVGGGPRGSFKRVIWHYPPSNILQRLRTTRARWPVF